MITDNNPVKWPGPDPMESLEVIPWCGKKKEHVHTSPWSRQNLGDVCESSVNDPESTPVYSCSFLFLLNQLSLKGQFFSIYKLFTPPVNLSLTPCPRVCNPPLPQYCRTLMMHLCLSVLWSSDRFSLTLGVVDREGLRLLSGSWMSHPTMMSGSYRILLQWILTNFSH
jgi:hypothetical protein